MTLKRKSLIRARTHFFWYTLALVLSMIYIAHAKGPVHVLVVMALFYVKVKTNLNKYVMWSLFALGTYAVTDYRAGTLDMETIQHSVNWIKSSLNMASEL
jgi:ABC-type nickel/cobalt efflux system permease component RcnA